MVNMENFIPSLQPPPVKVKNHTTSRRGANLQRGKAAGHLTLVAINFSPPVADIIL